jgi:predicted aconitase with swiveling domain
VSSGATNGSGLKFECRALTRGTARAPARVLSAPLSLWGGLDPKRGIITDRQHPQQGATLAKHVLVMPCGRGSTSSSSTLAEAARLGTAPVAIVLNNLDAILAVGAEVARLLYSVEIPIVVLDMPRYETIIDGAALTVVGDASGRGSVVIHD